MSQKIAVLLCNCGLTLDKRVDFEALKAHAAALDGVAAVEIVPALCMLPGQDAIARVVQESGATAIVAVSCSPRTHGHRIHDAARAAGVNRYLVEIVDLKGVLLSTGGGNDLSRVRDHVAMAVARTRLLEPLEPLVEPIEKSLVVIGGGVAGIAAAYVAANAGLRTYVVENGPRIGGRGLKLKVELGHAPLPASELAEWTKFITMSPKVSVLTGSKVTRLSGTAGRYTVTVQGPVQERDIVAGTVILASGASQSEAGGLYGLGTSSKVITQSAFEEKLPTGLPAGVKNLVFIQCAGSRDEKSVPYCSRTCCMVAMKQAAYVRKTWPEANVTVLFRDLQTGGVGTPLVKLLYHAPGFGIGFARFDPANPPVVGADAVEVKDLLTGESKRIPYDLAVLATPTVPAGGTVALAEMLGFDVDRFGFAAEPLMRARPVDHPERGVFVVGSAHWPCTMREAAQQGIEAASRAVHMIDAPK
ncbi:MAG: CoB--CoM heterodisulfide reductase iron-sulfur subunit A family protein, partial [Deltaproteobacteria bacterium]|nr:CoB--CoM heterodisulfide reductase iron-sulfur subunit A family protein [Deltaproteobacteria bacterium]